MESSVTLIGHTPGFQEAKEKASGHEPLVGRSEQVQPWKAYLDMIGEVNRKNPLDKDLFACSEGLNDHSLAG